MKVILKGGSKAKNQEMEDFFVKEIFQILRFGIAIEWSSRSITVFEKRNGVVDKYIDPTAEVIVELSPEAILLAKKSNTGKGLLREESNEFYDEALAIRMIEKLKPPFSIEYYCCSYSPAN